MSGKTESVSKLTKVNSTKLWIYFPRLLKASEKQRNAFIISGGGSGLHWDELDEDISVDNLLLGIGDQIKVNWK